MSTTYPAADAARVDPLVAEHRRLQAVVAATAVIANRPAYSEQEKAKALDDIRQLTGGI